MLRSIAIVTAIIIVTITGASYWIVSYCVRSFRTPSCDVWDRCHGRNETKRNEIGTAFFAIGNAILVWWVVLPKDFPAVGLAHGCEWNGLPVPRPVQPAVGNVNGAGLFHVGCGGASDALQVVWGNHPGPSSFQMKGPFWRGGNCFVQVLVIRVADRFQCVCQTRERKRLLI